MLLCLKPQTLSTYRPEKPIRVFVSQVQRKCLQSVGAGCVREGRSTCHGQAGLLEAVQAVTERHLAADKTPSPVPPPGDRYGEDRRPPEGHSQTVLKSIFLLKTLEKCFLNLNKSFTMGFYLPR